MARIEEGKPGTLAELRVIILKRISGKKVTQEAKLTRFLETNSRPERDALIKSREQIITLTTIINELL